MLTRTYRRHRPDSSRPARFVAGNPRGQAERLEHARIGEHHVARDASAWENSRVIDGDVADVVKREERDVVVMGSLSVAHELMAADLIDEYRLLTFPTILGTGERLFPAGGQPAYLECLSAEQAGATVLARYAPAGR